MKHFIVNDKSGRWCDVGLALIRQLFIIIQLMLPSQEVRSSVYHKFGPVFLMDSGTGVWSNEMFTIKHSFLKDHNACQTLSMFT